MSFQSRPASVSANWMASAPICIAVLSNLPNGCRPTPMMATSLVISGSFSDRLESERHDLVAVVVGGQRHQVLAGRTGEGRPRGEALGGPRHQRSAARQQQLGHLAPAAARAPLLHWERRGTTAA